MAIKAADKSLVQFLSPTEAVLYVIPSYQREYSWGHDQCLDLITDIVENSSGYFIGSIIWISSTKDIIDGQQRLTSLSLLLVAIFERLSALPEDEDIAYKKGTLKRMLVRDDNCRITLQKQGKNKDDFEYVIKRCVNKCPCAKPHNFGNRRISSNLSIFQQHLESYNREMLLDLFDKICGLSFISAEVDDAQTAFTLFETMNNRGMDLSAIDLVKCSYMKQTQDENSVGNWENLVSILGSVANQEQFLRNNYNAFRKECNNVTGPISQETKYDLGNKATRSNVIKIYDKLCSNDHFMQFVTENARFNSLLTGEQNPQIEAPASFIDAFARFRHANATSAFTLLLFLLRYQIPFDLKNDQMIELFDITLRFFIRRNLSNSPSTGAIPQILMNLIAEIHAAPNRSFTSIRSILKTVFLSKTPSDEAIKEILKGDIYETNRDMARYLLCSLCAQSDNRERRFVDLWAQDDGKYVWTIEHILPEGNKQATNIPACWIQMIREGNPAYANFSDGEILGLIIQYRHKIGNLTMTGYNSSLGNMSFAAKKHRSDPNNNPIGYDNGLSLNEEVVAQDAWTIDCINTRTNTIVDRLMEKLTLQ